MDIAKDVDKKIFFYLNKKNIKDKGLVNVTNHINGIKGKGKGVVIPRPSNDNNNISNSIVITSMLSDKDSTDRGCDNNYGGGSSSDSGSTSSCD